ncbi:hypothetical protein DRP07_05820 [Archaeoglobales archaeon]|nr:MAG: hypothetical protein DRP07_05820 [Archaeoglobales archaeon]
MVAINSEYLTVWGWICDVVTKHLFHKKFVYFKLRIDNENHNYFYSNNLVDIIPCLKEKITRKG